MILHRNKRKVAIFLVMLMIFTMFISYKQEADAIAPVVAAVAVVGVTLAAYALVTAGITFATTLDAEQAAQAVYTQFQTKFDQVVNSGKVMLALGTMSYKYVCTLTDDLWTDIKGWTDTNYNEGTNYAITGASTITMDWSMHLLSSNITANTALYKYLIVKNISSVSITTIRNSDNYNLGTQNFSIPSGYTSMYGLDLTPGQYRLYIYKYNGSYTSLWQAGPITTMNYTGETIPTGVSGQTGVIDNPEWTWSNPETGTKPIDIPLVGSPGAEDADFGYTNSAGDQVGLNVDANVLEGVINKTADDVIGASVAGTGAITIESSIPITAEAESDYTNAESTGTTSETETSLKFLLFTKFPFCLPWDLKAVVSLLASSPEAPNFTIDLLEPIGRAGIAVIDFDMEDYAIVGQVFRWTSLVEFCLCLILATRKLIWG